MLTTAIIFDPFNTFEPFIGLRAEEKKINYINHPELRCILGPTYNKNKDAKETVRYKRVLIVTELFNTAANDFDAEKSAHCSRVLVVSELVVSGTQCK